MQYDKRVIRRFGLLDPEGASCSPRIFICLRVTLIVRWQCGHPVRNCESSLLPVKVAAVAQRSIRAVSEPLLLSGQCLIYAQEARVQRIQRAQPWAARTACGPAPNRPTKSSQPSAAPWLALPWGLMDRCRCEGLQPLFLAGRNETRLLPRPGSGSVDRELVGRLVVRFTKMRR